jgi:uncharacterized protein YunC (DUF1805 family)
MPAPIIVADSITRVAPADAAGAVVVNASHGGIYAAYLAAKFHAAAAIFNDAGVGRDRAGIGGLDYLQGFGIAAATIGHETARIGDGADMMSSGVITHANCMAAALGVAPGQSCRDAATRLQRARPSDRAPPDEIEAAFLLVPEVPRVWAIDSASLVMPEYGEAIVVTGSHGGLLGGKAETALKYDVLGALYNDAGIGKDAAGVSRLPALDARDIAAATVAAMSARIGDARSTYEDGVISRVNTRAAALGLRKGMTARAFVAGLRRALAG